MMWRKSCSTHEHEKCKKEFHHAGLSISAPIRYIRNAVKGFTVKLSQNWKGKRLTKCDYFTLPNRNIFLGSIRRKYFILDPDFLKLLLTAGYDRTVEFIQYVSQHYFYERGITENSDKYVAISGVETRIAHALRCRSIYGIFETYLHRNLFWQATDKKLERVVYKEEQYVPF